MPVTIEPLANLVPTSGDYGRMAFVGSDLLAILVSEGQDRTIRPWSVEWIVQFLGDLFQHSRIDLVAGALR